MGISVVTSTNREENSDLILNNFLRQNYSPKELIIVLNYDNPKVNIWSRFIKNHENISIYYLGGQPSLGKCLNLGISKAKYDYVSKFDDDDYYGPNYLESSLNTLEKYKAHIVGKASILVYFKEKQILGLKNSNKENKFVFRVEGSTLFFNKSLMKDISFKDKSLGEDLNFCKDAISKGFKIYSGDRYNYVYIRNQNTDHTWKIHNDYLIRECINLSEPMPFNDLITGGNINY